MSELRSPAENLTSLEVRSAALVERMPDGTLNVPEGGDSIIGFGTASGGQARRTPRSAGPRSAPR